MRTRTGRRREPEAVGEGRYELGRVLGHDGHVEVRRAHDRLLRRPVTVRRHGPQDPESGPWRREVDALGLLDHDHIVRLHDGGLEDRGAYSVLQVAGVGPLRRTGRETPRAAALWCVGLAGALKHMHDRGVVHHAVGAGSVLVDEAGVPRLSGFTEATTGGAGPDDRAADIRGLADVAITMVRARHVPAAVVAELTRALGAASSSGSGRSAVALDELTALLVRAGRSAGGPRYTLHGSPGRRLAATVTAIAAVAALTGGIAVALPGIFGGDVASVVAQPPVGSSPTIATPDRDAPASPAEPDTPASPAVPAVPAVPPISPVVLVPVATLPLAAPTGASGPGADATGGTDGTDGATGSGDPAGRSSHEGPANDGFDTSAPTDDGHPVGSHDARHREHEAQGGGDVADAPKHDADESDDAGGSVYSDTSGGSGRSGDSDRSGHSDDGDRQARPADRGETSR